MPLSSDDKTNALASEIVAVIRALFGNYPGFRPNHAKGILISGHFQPSTEAKSLSTAPHLNQQSTPVTVRFSNNTGVPQIPDTDPQGNPKGMSIRFHLGRRKHTDIVSQSTPFFPVNNGPDFLALLKAILDGTAPDFVSTHPAALQHLQAPKPAPKSFASHPYFGIHAVKFVNQDGKQTFFRYQIVPTDGIQTYTDDELKDKSPNFLFEEIGERLEAGPVTLNLLAQIADDGDATNDATVYWPEDRKKVNLGTITLESVIENSGEQQRTIIFDPIPRVDGIEPSDDPLPELRAAAYLISGRERRAAGGNNP